jgi:hypothetical protein
MFIPRRARITSWIHQLTITTWALTGRGDYGQNGNFLENLTPGWSE